MIAARIMWLSPSIYRLANGLRLLRVIPKERRGSEQEVVAWARSLHKLLAPRGDRRTSSSLFTNVGEAVRTRLFAMVSYVQATVKIRHMGDALMLL
jgi:hypothetical protein